MNEPVIFPQEESLHEVSRSASLLLSHVLHRMNNYPDISVLEDMLRIKHALMTIMRKTALPGRTGSDWT